MLTRLLARLRREQRGFTLVETLVACVTGVVVTGALFTILDFSVKQNSRLSGVAQATQVGRTAMTRISEELHSACLSTGFTPVVEGSTPSKLILVNGYDEKEKGSSSEPPAELLAESIHKDVIEYKEGKLTDTVYKAESNTPIATGETGFAEKYKFSTTPALTFKVAQNVSQGEEGGKPIPIFKYYAYRETPLIENGKPVSELEETTSLTPTETSKLSAAGAEETAAVVVTFRTAPYSKEARLSAASEKGQLAELTTETTFAFSAPNSEATIAAEPCE